MEIVAVQQHHFHRDPFQGADQGQAREARADDDHARHFEPPDA